MKTLPAVCVLLLSVGFGQALAESITLAVASNFTGPMKALATAFEEETGHEVTLSFGSSGRFYAQIVHGAPYHLFFSADQAKPKALEQQDRIVEGSRTTYAVGSLALWSATPGLALENAELLRQGDYNKLALANPRLAPYGVAAVETLENLGLADSTRPHWVQGENIAQAYQFVETGNAEVGFVALSQIMQDGEIKSGSGWVVPAELHNPIRQDAVLLLHGENSTAARDFLRYIQTDSARNIIEAYGYTTSTQ